MRISFTKVVSIIAALFLFTASAQAQFQTVYVGLKGMTCRHCADKMEAKLKELVCVKGVETDIVNSKCKITLEEKEHASIIKIARAIINTGFEATYMQADLAMTKDAVLNDHCLNYDGDQFVFQQTPKGPLTGVIKLSFLGRQYMPRKEYKRVHPTLNTSCSKVFGKTYYVTLDTDH